MKNRKRLFQKMLYLFCFFVLLVVCGTGVQAATPYETNGQLSVSGNKIVNSKGKTFVIQGVSTHGMAWYPEYVNKTAFKELRDQWGVNTIRLALYTAEYNGYCTGGNQKDLKKLIDNGVQYATDLGMYVIIDWHILSDGNPLTYKSESNTFFKEIAKKYSSYGNVMYEICNEPNGSGGSWKNIKSYAETIIKTIRSVNKNAIIIVGTPTWSQDVDTAAGSKIAGYTNIAYAFHFYAGTHQDSYRNKLESALKKNLPVIVTEFGITDASGNGSVNKTQGNKWIALLDQYKVGRICWNLSNKNESSALIKNTCTKKNGWTYSNLSEQGKWLVQTYKGKLASITPPPTPKPTPKPTQKPTATPKPTPKVTPTPKPTATPTPKPSSTTSKTATSTGTVKLKAALKKTNSWKSGEKSYTQYTLTIKNTGTKSSTKWTVTATFGQNVKRNGEWSGTYSASKKKLTIKPLDWNKIIKKGETTELGFILESPKTQTITDLTITAN